MATTGLRQGRTLACGLFLCALGLSIPACGEAGSADQASAPQPDFVHTYEGILGEVQVLPDPPAMPLQIRHVHIPEFRGSDGEIFVAGDGTPGMKPMTMPFPDFDDGASPDGLAVGDKVRFDFRVHWTGGQSRYWITEIEVIDPETQIDYSIQVDNQNQPGDAP